MAEFWKRDEFLARPLRHEDVEFDGRALRVWELRGDQIIAAGSDDEGKDDKTSGMRFAAKCIGGEEGPFAPPFAVDDMKAMGAAAVGELVAAALRVNGRTTEAAEAARKN